ncbi:Cytochrome P450, E-class, group I [Trema orientale]|uniref:Cytochrome P450, E-class, group I n=1 Tax=Trema orientale TaxID=63057 RepID=A0A2P5ESV0_TREOI|nr:Cytochrome P450, E-class, group I [Trema orientale]
MSFGFTSKQTRNLKESPTRVGRENWQRKASHSAGTRLLVNASKLHRDPTVWSDPFEFKPERFLTTHQNVDVKGQNFELTPFGRGRRMCPGVLLALQVMQLTLAALLHGFEIKMPLEQPVDMMGTIGLTLFKALPLDVLLTLRLPPIQVYQN